MADRVYNLFSKAMIIVIGESDGGKYNFVPFFPAIIYHFQSVIGVRDQLRLGRGGGGAEVFCPNIFSSALDPKHTRGGGGGGGTSCTYFTPCRKKVPLCSVTTYIGDFIRVIRNI